MKYSSVVLGLAVLIEASPFPQGVTQSIAPSGTAPAGCLPTYPGTFGIAVMNITAPTAGAGKAAVKQGADGQAAASSATVVSTIADGQPQAPTSGGGAVVSTIADGQPQVPTSAAPISQIGDGQIQAPTITMGGINQIGDGQIQNQRPTTSAVKQITDGQIQNPKPTTSAVGQISDGQIQNKPTSAVGQISDGQIQNKPTSAVGQISDGQIQNKPTTSAAQQISDGQVQQPKPTTSAVGQIGDGQPQVTSAAGSQPDGQPTAGPGGSAQPSGGASSYVACKKSDTLQITLANGVLKDNQGRTGYIASNYQFQFDGPPQAGAIYTAGFSVCNNGTLALGGSTTFYQCLSGDFYNLYDRNWAPQCLPIQIQALQLVNC